jgi:LPXTG-motif cell wall-anchored protein
MLKNRNLAKGGKGMKYYVYVAALTLAAAGTAMAGVSPAKVSVPVFTPWGTLITAAALGAGGLFTFFRKKK